MSTLDSIGIRVEGGPISGQHDAVNALPVLNEIRHALAILRDRGQSTIIDLSAMPFGPGDKDRLKEVLGRGEVSATIDSLGETRIYETTYPGVWYIEYLSPSEAELAVHIEITAIPSLLATPQEEIEDSLHRLETQLSADQTSTFEKEQE